MSKHLSMAVADTSSRWRDWLQEHGGKLLLFARQQTRRPQDAEDVLQEALVKLAKKEEAGVFVGGQEAWLQVLAGQLPDALAGFEQGLFLPQGRRAQLLLLYSMPSTSSKSESRAPPSATARR